MASEIVNKLTYVKKSEVIRWGNATCEYLCTCGKTCYYPKSSVTSGKYKSCGCSQKEHISKINLKHGLKAGNKRLYKIWCAMRFRCNNPNDSGYYNYGKRGISVCDDWNSSFQYFYDWATKNGYADNLSIDRIENADNYCPENCRWADRYTQAHNTRRSVGFDKAEKITSDYNTGKYTHIELASINGVSRATVQRIIYGKTYNRTI